MLGNGRRAIDREIFDWHEKDPTGRTDPGHVDGVSGDDGVVIEADRPVGQQ
jgi:hypothetical protein